MHIHLVSAAAAAVVLAAVAPVHARDRNGYEAITAKEYAKAERRLIAERRIFPGKPELMLNLAAVYMKTGRPEQARDLYAEVLDRPAAEMVMPSGQVATSHDVANAGLAALGRDKAVASR